MRHPRSTAQIAGHPIHPMLVPFPIAFWLAALVCDVTFVANGGEGWFTASVWLIGAGLVFALLAAVFGFVDFFSEPLIRELRHAWEHMLGNLVAAVIAAVNLGLRIVAGTEAVIPWGLTLSCLIGLILLFTGWRGADLVYKHATGVAQNADAFHQTNSDPLKRQGTGR